MNVEKPDSSTDPNFVNAQPPERESTTPYELGVHSTFVTIQGEGPCTGQKALFIRLAGCNLQCPKCDTDYTSHREFWTDEAFVHNTIVKHPDVDLYVITGGEPLRQTAALINCIERLDSYLIKERRAIRIQIETNGVYSPFLDNFCNVDVIYVVSPKTSHITHDDTELFDFWKYVMSAERTGAVHTTASPNRMDHGIQSSSCVPATGRFQRSGNQSPKHGSLRPVVHEVRVYPLSANPENCGLAIVSITTTILVGSSFTHFYPAWNVP